MDNIFNPLYSSISLEKGLFSFLYLFPEIISLKHMFYTTNN